MVTEPVNMDGRLTTLLPFPRADLITCPTFDHFRNLTVMRKEIHIVSNPNRGGWDAKRPNADRASKHFDTKKEAMEWSRDLAKREGLELIPHGTDGKIQNPNSYGNDPCPPKDTKH